MPPPLRLAVDIEKPDGTHNRWGLDEPDPANVPSGLSFGTQMPGGFEQMSCTLARKPGLDYSDLAEFSTITVYGAGGETAWQGRLQSAPRTSGERISITPAAVGWQAHLDDDRTAQPIYVDQSLQSWTAPSATRLGAIRTANVTYEAAETTVDAANALPAIIEITTFPTPGTDVSEVIYDAGPANKIATIRYAFNCYGVDPANANWTWGVSVYDNDALTGSSDTTGDLGSASSGTAYWSPATPRRVGYLYLQWGVAASGAGQRDELHWQVIAVYGNHGLTRQTSIDPNGFLASDVVQHAVSTWASKLATSRAGASTIEATTFVIPQLAFRDPTTVSAIIAEALKYEVFLDWWVDEGPTFNLASWGNHGRDWRARVGPSGLQETGPDVARMCNRVIVSYNDVAGVVRTVGPTGSGADTIDDTLADTDPSNPVTAAGLVRGPPQQLPNIGVSTPEGAAAVGRRFLLEQRAKSTAGQANIVGHVEDSRGVLWPAWAIRAGDRVTFVDAHDPVPRRIVRTQYSDSSKSCQLDLDSPAQDLDALLARYGAAR